MIYVLGNKTFWPRGKNVKKKTVCNHKVKDQECSEEWPNKEYKGDLQ